MPIGSSTVAGLATALGTEVWVVAGVGRRLPPGFLDAMVERATALCADADPWELDVEVLTVGGQP